MKQTYITHSGEETRRIGAQLARNLDHGLITLTGDLGFGKTTFVQGFAKGLGITKRIISPTFIILRTYDIPRNNKRFYHIDLYRVKSEHDLEGLGIKEVLEDPRDIILIEWPDKLGSLLPEARINVIFEYISENERKIIVE